MRGEDGERDKDDKWKPPPEKADLKLWGILAFTVIGATATTFAVHQLRRTFDWVYTQVARSQSTRKGTRGGSFRTAFQEEAWRRHNKRMQEEYEEELERVERIRRMQSVFNRERNKFRRGYENWKEDDPGAHQYHQQFQRHDWYWKTESSYRNQKTNHQEPPNQSRVYPLSHHYSVLGLSRSRAAPYTEAEIKKAFREKAMEFHPDQNQDNKDVSEAKFKEVLFSYEAIKKERKDMKMTRNKRSTDFVALDNLELARLERANKRAKSKIHVRLRCDVEQKCVVMDATTFKTKMLDGKNIPKTKKNDVNCAFFVLKMIECPSVDIEDISNYMME